jgi:UDP-N-acetylglucosamine:LPS N-acetylglucosamine transferase
VITKPGYGTFVEAACAGRPILYLERDDWPETPNFADWLAQHARAGELRRDKLLAGDFMAELEALLARPAPPSPLAEGAGQAARLLAGIFGARTAGRGGNV